MLSHVIRNDDDAKNISGYDCAFRVARSRSMLRMVFISILALISANASATTLLDNSGSPLVFADDLRVANRGGISFTVGATGYVLSAIKFVPVTGATTGDDLGDITIGVYPWDPATNTISGAALVSETFVGLLFTELNSASWANEETVAFTSTTTLNANSSYIIVFGPTARSSSGLLSGIATAGVPASTGSSGLTLLNGDGYSTDSGATWGTSGNLLVSISGIPTSSIPSLSEWSQLMLALMTIMLVGWYFHRERSY